MEKRLRLKNDIRELETMNRFLKECGEAMALPTAFLMSLNLVMEEAVSNIIFYAYDQAQRIDDAVDIKICREDDRLWIHLEDHGKPFDPTAKADPDISLSAEERPIGGLGIFLIKKIMDKVSYTREGDKNIFTMSKKITES